MTDPREGKMIYEIVDLVFGVENLRKFRETFKEIVFDKSDRFNRWAPVKYHGRGGPWLRRGLWREASGTTGGEFNSARARPREGLAWNR